MAALSRATRRIVVAHLTVRGMKPAEIASELDVSADTVRRDLDATPAAATPDPATPSAPDVDTLTLRLDEPLREALAVLRSVRNGPDTPEQNTAAARAAIRATADAVLDARPAAGPERAPART